MSMTSLSCSLVQKSTSTVMVTIAAHIGQVEIVVPEMASLGRASQLWRLAADAGVPKVQMHTYPF
jgi:hypothetical protein